MEGAEGRKFEGIRPATFHNGPADQVLVVGEMTDPQPAPGVIRIQVQWSGVNPSDVKARSGARGPVMPFLRVIPHSDGMGVIDAIGAGVDPARIGERVWLWNAGWMRPFGSAAELVCLPAQQAVFLPANVPGEVGACLGIPALTALPSVHQKRPRLRWPLVPMWPSTTELNPSCSGYWTVLHITGTWFLVRISICLLWTS